MTSKWDEEVSNEPNSCNKNSEGRKRELLTKKGAKKTPGHFLSCFFFFLNPACQIEMTLINADRKRSSSSRFRKIQEGLRTI